jgi:hypothetical protein
MQRLDLFCFAVTPFNRDGAAIDSAGRSASRKTDPGHQKTTPRTGAGRQGEPDGTRTVRPLVY